MKDLIFSKWTKVKARLSPKHFLVRQHNEDNGFVLLQSVIDKSTVKIPAKELVKSNSWQRGWHSY